MIKAGFYQLLKAQAKHNPDMQTQEVANSGSIEVTCTALNLHFSASHSLSVKGTLF